MENIFQYNVGSGGVGKFPRFQYQGLHPLLVHPGVGPHRPVTNDRDRRRSPRLFFLPFCYFFLIGKAAYFRIFSHFDFPVLPGLEPPMIYLRKKNTKFDAKSDDRCSVSKGKWHKEGVLWAACTSRGGQYDWLPSTCPLIMFFDCFLA